MKEIELTILMPCLNESRSLAFCIRQAQDYIRKEGICGEILVADNGSTDGSRQIAADCGARVEEVSARGYGNALIGGIRASRGRYIIMGDCDGSYDFSECGLFLKKLREGCGLVVGNRYLGGIEKRSMAFWHRYVGVPVLSMIGRRRYGVGIGDFHCGIRGFDREKALALGLRCGGMEFATELIGRFAQAGESVCEVPAKLYRDRRRGPSHLRAIPDGWRHLRLMLGSEKNGENRLKRGGMFVGKGKWKGFWGLWMAAVLSVCFGPATVNADDVPWKTASADSALKQETVAAYLYQGSREILASGVIDRTEEGMSQITVKFDTAFGDQEPFQNIQIPQDQKLKGWRLWGYHSGSGFVGQEEYEIPSDGQISASQYQELNTDPANDSLLVVPLWRNAREILNGDSLEMRAGDNCILSEGMWTVEGDSTLYSGGRTVYGARDGIFTFRKQE